MTREEGAGYKRKMHAGSARLCCESQRAFVRHSQVVREHYLREDIYSGSPLDPECDPSAYKLSPDAERYIVLDTNVALHQVRCRIAVEYACILPLVVVSLCCLGSCLTLFHTW